MKLATTAGWLCLLLASCKTGEPSKNLVLETSQTPSKTMVLLAKTAQTCWFKSRDPAFRSHKLASEVNSYAGQPRFLLVPKNNPTGLPLLVVQAQSDQSSDKATKVQVFGPLLQSENGKRIANDVMRWSKGNTKCSA